MSSSNIVDIAHISFLEIIKNLIEQSGPASTKGVLMRMAISTASKVEKREYATLPEYVASIESAENPITVMEGKARHLGDGVFGLPQCPFADSIKNYTEVLGGLPAGYGELTAEFNKPGAATDRYRIGNGAGVSPFCAVHQTIRSALAERITIGGQGVKAYQLGCKSGAGVKALSERWISESGSVTADVEGALDDNMCCYLLKVDE